MTIKKQLLQVHMISLEFGCKLCYFFFYMVSSHVKEIWLYNWLSLKQFACYYTGQFCDIGQNAQLYV